MDESFAVNTDRRNEIIRKLGDTANLILNKVQSFDLISTDMLEKVLDAKNEGFHNVVVPKGMQFNSNGGAQSGIAEIFKTHYNSVIKEDMDEVIGVFKVMSVEINCDIEVLKVFKAISKTGITYNEKIKSACSQIAYSITAILNPKITYITKQMVVEKLNVIETDLSGEVEEGVKYYTDILLKSVRGVLK